MLFSSYEFIFLFLPATWLAWYVLYKSKFNRAVICVIWASLIFYGWWNPSYLLLLVSSLSFNYWIAGKILKTSTYKRAWLYIGLSFNLTCLFYFKYAFFVSQVFTQFTGISTHLIHQEVLPLGISFITFQKIAYLIDCQRGLIHEHRIRSYTFFVTFFPQLIAGPIVHHNHLAIQINNSKNPLFFDSTALAAGVSLFSIGLFKKIVLADSFALYANPIFEQATLAPINPESAWIGMLSYTLQLYFDFSGYSDMALGLGLLFGFKLPINFLSPYKATSIIDFWRRWNISLSDFLRDYIYIPLGGNRNGELSTYRNIVITMGLAGVWHGAGWTFILWGLWHGLLLTTNHWFREINKTKRHIKFIPLHLQQFLSFGITFISIALGWVLFRANSLDDAINIYKSLVRPFQFHLPTHEMITAFLGAANDAAWLWVALGLLICWAMPNSMQLVNYDPIPNKRLNYSPNLAKGFAAGLLFIASIKWMYTAPSTEFLYFNF